MSMEPAFRAATRATPSDVAKAKTEHLGPCNFYISPEQPECGAPGVKRILVGSRASHAVSVVLCGPHLQQHNVSFARQRKEKQQQRPA